MKQPPPRVHHEVVDHDALLVHEWRPVDYTDLVVKALALGATAVGIGRPYACGLALGGADGVVHVLRSILAEADLIMAVDGYPTRADLTPDSLRQVR